MGSYDKDRPQKELALRYCLARSMVPFLEVVLPSVSNLSDTEEVLTDLDVVGIHADDGGSQRAVLFDCKSTRRMSAVNRAFWASGVKTYVGCEQAYVLQGGKPLTNHRLSALVLDVDLHDEDSFVELGRRVDEAFPSDTCYQASISRWEAVYLSFKQANWTKGIFELAHHKVPLTKVPWVTFRHMIVELRRTRGEYDPERATHVALFLDVLASAMVLWGVLARDISRFFEARMDQGAFEQVLRYYIWGGKEAFNVRIQLAKLADKDATDLPAWGRLVDFAAMTVSAPRCLLSAAHAYRELAFRTAGGRIASFDDLLRERFADDNRLRQFMLGMNGYMVEAAGLPTDLGKVVDGLLLTE